MLYWKQWWPHWCYFHFSPSWHQETAYTGKLWFWFKSEFKLGLKWSHNDPLRRQIVISKMKNQLLLFSLKLVYFLKKLILQRRELQRKYFRSIRELNTWERLGFPLESSSVKWSPDNFTILRWEGQRWICRTDKDLAQDAYCDFP